MHAGAIYDFSKDSVVLEQLAVVRKMWSTPGSSHDQRMILLAPMAVQCNTSMVESVWAAITESEMRGTYEMMRKYGVA